MTSLAAVFSGSNGRYSDWNTTVTRSATSTLGELGKVAIEIEMSLR